ncbi:hypothetical protein E1B28_012753 [Marasmius oreades]|uniref:Uncharacterized protein n=1 Tax=Marasmius oreades TaxID=181124 RepID=A0A9P7UR43_9AGAR|nr:uncharacterized protein E1B28_012753 [Marasmius oreades]KAG7088789.1 hypothetical protein E1B28_012753 [Marasmius oreades]
MAEPILSSRASHRRQRLAQLELEQQAEDIEAFEAIRACSVDVDADGEVAWWDLDGLAFRGSTNIATVISQQPPKPPITPPLVTKPAEQESYFPQHTVEILVQNHLAKRELQKQRSPVKAVFDTNNKLTDTDSTIRVPLAKRKPRFTDASTNAPFPRAEGEGEGEVPDPEGDIDVTIRLPTAKRTCRVSLATLATGTTGSNTSYPSYNNNKFPLIPVKRDRFSAPPVMSHVRARAHTLTSTSTSLPPASLDRAWSRIRGIGRGTAVSGREIPRRPTPAAGVIMGGSTMSSFRATSKRKRD